MMDILTIHVKKGKVTKPESLFISSICPPLIICHRVSKFIHLSLVCWLSWVDIIFALVDVKTVLSSSSIICLSSFTSKSWLNDILPRETLYWWKHLGHKTASMIAEPSKGKILMKKCKAFFYGEECYND